MTNSQKVFAKILLVFGGVLLLARCTIYFMLNFGSTTIDSIQCVLVLIIVICFWILIFIFWKEFNNSGNVDSEDA